MSRECRSGFVNNDGRISPAQFCRPMEMAIQAGVVVRIASEWSRIHDQAAAWVEGRDTLMVGIRLGAENGFRIMPFTQCPFCCGDLPGAQMTWYDANPQVDPDDVVEDGDIDDGEGDD